MNASQLVDQALQARNNLCPTWCEREHLGIADDPRGFHHDGAVTAVPVEDPVNSRSGDYLFVNVSQREHGSEVEQAYVEVQDEERTLALLTPAECVLLAQALLEGASQIRKEDEPLENRLPPELGNGRRLGAAWPGRT